jgi:hypothetical protein
MRFGSVWIDFEKSNPKSYPNRQFSQKNIQTDPKYTVFFMVFGSVCDFYLDWFGFEGPYLGLWSVLLSKSKVRFPLVSILTG